MIGNTGVITAVSTFKKVEVPGHDGCSVNKKLEYEQFNPIFYLDLLTGK
jgi:hypothetical protein